MEIQFELEDETSFMKYLRYTCLRCRGKIIIHWNLTTIIVLGWLWEIIMGYVLATFVKFATSPWLILLMEQLRHTSWVWKFIPLYIYHGFYTSQVVQNFFHQQYFKQKNQKQWYHPFIPQKKCRAVCTQVGAKHSNCWVLLEVNQGISKSKKSTNAPNASGMFS